MSAIVTRLWRVMVIAAMALACASGPPVPTPTRPIPACYISCPGGYWVERQQLCRGSVRWFTNVLLVGEYTQRSVDGTLSVNQWVANDGQMYNKDSVKLGACSVVISQIIQSRSVTERGQYPGEDPQGNSLTPP